MCHNFAGNNKDGYYNKIICYVYPSGDSYPAGSSGQYLWFYFKSDSLLGQLPSPSEAFGKMKQSK